MYGSLLRPNPCQNEIENNRKFETQARVEHTGPRYAKNLYRNSEKFKLEQISVPIQSWPS